MSKPKHKNIMFLYSLLVLSFFFSYFFRVSTSVVLPMLQISWGLGAGIIGLISSMYFYAYAVMQPICGVLNDKFGPMKVVGCGIIISSMGSFIFGLGNSAGVLIIGRLLTGIGLSPMLSGLLVFQGNHFPPEKYAFFSGLSMMIGNMGAVFSVGPLSASLTRWGRGGVFTFLGIATLGIAFFLLREGREKTGNNVPGNFKEEALERFFLALEVLKQSRELRIVILMWMVTFGALMSFQGLWAFSWFKTAYPEFKNWASPAASMIGIGVMAGNFMGGRICRDTSKRHRVIAASVFIIFLLWLFLLAAFYFSWPIPAAVIISVLLGIASGNAFVQFTAAIQEIAPPGQGGAVFGIANGLVFSCIILYQWGTGMMIGFLQRSLGGALPYCLAFLPVALSVSVPCIAARYLRRIEKVLPMQKTSLS